jgi:hypothetical protein
MTAVVTVNPRDPNSIDPGRNVVGATYGVDVWLGGEEPEHEAHKSRKSPETISRIPNLAAMARW